jgi:succinate dehydrogenase/fumarate reductase flavoprotein subunit
MAPSVLNIALPQSLRTSRIRPNQPVTTRIFSKATPSHAEKTNADVLIVGSGAAGLSAALRCHQHGLKPLLVEKSDKVGGTSAWSGGGLWVPCNDQQKGRGINDSEEKALQYLDGIIGDAGPASSPERRLAYVRNARKVFSALSVMGCRWIPTDAMPDYHTDVPGSVEKGRTIEPALFNARELGSWRQHLNPPSVNAVPGMEIAEAFDLTHITTGPGIRTVLKVIVRTLRTRLMGQELLGCGQALTGQLLKVNIDHGTEIWRSSPMKQLLVNPDGKATGAVFVRDGQEVTVEAPAVVLVAGGFAKNDAMRKLYHAQPTDANWSNATQHDTGEVMQSAMNVGAATALMNEVWWDPSFLNPVSNVVSVSFGERGRAGTIVVDSNGHRFLNEARSYNDFGRTMYIHNQKTACIPAWMVFDSGFAKRVPFRLLGPRLSKKDGLRSKFLYQSSSLHDLAQQINVDAEGLQNTVERFNKFARDGKDPDFHRGETVSDMMSVDKRKGIKACLGPLEKPPYYAVRIYPGDLGTKGGLLTDEHARVLDEKHKPINGLYAAGNNSASVMGSRYPGGGATLGPAITFASLAVDHAAGKPWTKEA